MPAGRRTHLITIERQTVSGRDGFNAPVYGAPLTFQRLAARDDLSDGERAAAGETGAFAAARFTVLSDPQTREIRPTDRLVTADRSWDITAVKPRAGSGRNQEIEISARVRAD